MIRCADCGRILLADGEESHWSACAANECRSQNGDELFYRREDGEYICERCYEESYFCCEDCGEIYPKEEECWEDGVGRSVCSACDEDYETCEQCGERYPIASMTETDDGGYVCDWCYDHHYGRCCECGGVFYASAMVNDNEDNIYCQACYDNLYTTCCECGEELRLDDSCSGPNGPTCESCVESLGYVQCTECGEYVEREEAYESPDGSSLCEYCFTQMARASGVSPEELTARIRQTARERLRAKMPPLTILSYHCNTERCFLAQDGEDTKMFFGIELEVEAAGLGKADAAKKTLSALNQNADGEARNHWTAMKDGSLNGGFELISQPMTAKYFDEEVAPRLEPIFEDMIRMGLRSHDTSTCGLHFHVSRNALSDDTMVNMEIAADKFKDTLVKISRRRSEALERWAYIVEIADNFELWKRATWDQHYEEEKRYLGNRGRYHALNYTNKDTVEFRACRGTLNYKSFIGCLHFFRFLIDWCASHTFRQILEEVSEEQFISDAAAYSPELKAYMTGRGLIAAENVDSLAA